MGDTQSESTLLEKDFAWSLCSRGAGIPPAYISFAVNKVSRMLYIYMAYQEASSGMWQHHLASSLSDGQIRSEKVLVARFPSLIFKRSRRDMILVYKIVNRIDKLDPGD